MWYSGADMRLHRFYIQNDILETIDSEGHGMCADESISFQISKVLRLGPSDLIYLFNESVEYECSLIAISKKSFTYAVLSKKTPKTPRKKIYLVQSLVKKDKLELIVQKATELGVTHIIPVISERSEKRGIVMERLEKIRIESMEQSGWGSGPCITPAQTLDSAITELKRQGINICYLHMDGEKYEKGKGFECICVGPEGGWGERDIEIFKKNKVKAISLEGGVLRAETASIVGSFLLTQ